MSYSDYLDGLRDGIGIGLKVGVEVGYRAGRISGYLDGYDNGYIDKSLELPYNPIKSLIDNNNLSRYIPPEPIKLPDPIPIKYFLPEPIKLPDPIPIKCFLPEPIKLPIVEKFDPLSLYQKKGKSLFDY